MNLLLEVFSEIMVDLLANHHIHQAVVELFLKDFSNQLASHHVSPLQLRLDPPPKSDPYHWQLGSESASIGHDRLQTSSAQQLEMAHLRPARQPRGSAPADRAPP